MINIISLKWGTKFSPDYVNRLYKGFKRNTTIPFTFHCVTENPKGIVNGVTIHKLPNTGLEIWWNKLWLFSKEFPLEGRVVFVDLDTLIVGNVDDIISHDNGFTIVRDFYHAKRKPSAPNAQSCIMSFEAHKHHYIWDDFIKNPSKNMKKGHGDQGWIQFKQRKFLYYQDLFPNQIVSFKLHCKNGPPNNARIICYHGKPSIEDSISKTTRAQGIFKPAPWVKDHWKD